MRVHLQNMAQWINSLPLTVVALALGGLLVSTSACSVVKAANQPPKKDLSVFSPGTPRGRVIAEVGSPAWSEENGGERTDVFSFTQGYSKCGGSPRHTGRSPGRFGAGGPHVAYRPGQRSGQD